MKWNSEMDIGIIAGLYPHVVEVVGPQWFVGSTERCGFTLKHKGWFLQLDKDLSLLKTRVGIEKLTCYRDLLRTTAYDQLLDTIYEVHGSALLSVAASDIDLHVPRGDGTRKNFDVRATIQGTSVNADSKTRVDDSLFRDKYRWIEEGVDRGFFRERATIDPHDASEMGIEARHTVSRSHYQPIPESTNIREKLRETLSSQLPEVGCNLIIFGHKQGGDKEDLERALYGAEMPVIVRNHTTGESWVEWQRSPTGAFRSDDKGIPFHPLRGVLWVRLMTNSCDDTKLYRSYKLYLNPFADPPMPAPVKEAVQRALDDWRLE